MAGASLELEYCLAQEADFEEVMAISTDIYGGLDYLPARYHTWLLEATRKVFLAKKEGRVVALVSVSVVDDGRTAVVEGLRVAPAERGRGIAGLVQRHALAAMKSSFPCLEVQRSSRSGPLGPEVLAKYRMICHQGVLVLHFLAAELRPKLSAAIDRLKGWEDPVRLEIREVKEVFLDPKVVEKVLPGGTITWDWSPYQPLQSNLEMLVTRGICWMADSRDNPSVLSLSAAPYKVPAGVGHLRLNIDIFGRDYPLVRGQFLAQLRRGLEPLQGPIHCLVYMDPSLWPELRAFCKGELGLQNGHLIDGQKLLEAEI
ncbi:histidine N-acetyltransferase [Leucoraja erinacea]|uniref:histidine N-acetyltransferase n=1 Tax=Leucoraja erinaceus TaxID=7782 RepID=UPI0024579DD5|nr:histidine N-acetyltransferase [Leucoraja erinacea]